MRFDAITLHRVRLRRREPFVASGHTADWIDHVVVEAETADGVAWGECAVPSDPYYLPETVETVWHVLRDFLVPAVLGRTWSTPEDLETLCAPVRGNYFAKSGLDMAAWDAFARDRGQSVAACLGATAKSVAAGVSFGIEADAGTLDARIGSAVAAGYRRVKLKIAPGRDVDTLRRVRRAWPEVPLIADANSAYTLDDLPLLRRLDDLGLMMLEQPLGWDDMLDHAELQRHLRTPVCLDESICSVRDAALALRLGSCRVIAIKPAHVGGLTEARRIHDLCAAAGVPVWCGGMHDFGIARAANLAVAALPNFSMPADVAGSDLYYAADIIKPPIVAEDGMVPVPSGPGLGVTVDVDAVRDHTVDRVTLHRPSA